MSISNRDYWVEVKSIAAQIAEEAVGQVKEGTECLGCDEQELKEAAEEIINDTLLHETIDGHEWVIYYSYNLDVIQHSSNDEAYQEIYNDSDAGQFLADGGLNSLHSMIAFWALYADVQDYIDDALDSELDED